MKFILGTKESMTQVFDDLGVVSAATIVRVEPHVVTQVKTVESDGYAAVQVATGAQKESRVSKAERGHAKGAYKFSREERDAVGMETGASYDASVFAPGDAIEVSGITKGKGFQGVVKRHGFGGGRASHGQKHSLREPGAIGGGGRAGGRVSKGMRMAGRMGGDRVTVKNLRVLQVNVAENTLLIAGALPGRKGTLLEIRGV
jgi:large subunit ribosomal protein L3